MDAAAYYNDIEFVTACVSAESRQSMNFLSGRSYHTLQYQHYGRIHFTVNGGEEFTVEAPSLLITRPAATCVFGNERSPWHHNFLGFRGARVDRMLAQGLLPVAQGKECACFKIKDGEAFFSLFRQCVGHARASSPMEAAFAANSLERLLLHLASEKSLPDSIRRAPKLDSLIFQMRASPMGDWDFQKAARRMRMSEGHFARLFKESAGLPPKKFLLKCRMDLAADMLATSAEPIKLVAEAAGFNDLQYFYRKFKDARLMTPAEFRRKFSRAYWQEAGRSAAASPDLV